MSRFSKLIDQLEDLNARDVKNTAAIFGIAADLYMKLDRIVSSNAIGSSNQSLLGESLSKDELLKLKRDLQTKLDWVNSELKKLD